MAVTKFQEMTRWNLVKVSDNKNNFIILCVYDIKNIYNLIKLKSSIKKLHFYDPIRLDNKIVL